MYISNVVVIQLHTTNIKKKDKSSRIEQFVLNTAILNTNSSIKDNINKKIYNYNVAINYNLSTLTKLFAPK